MPALYLDASALVKHYIIERGSAWIAEQLTMLRPDDAARPFAATTLLSNVEVVCALERARRNGRIDTSSVHFARRRFLSDMRRRYLVLDANLDTALLAVRLAQRYPLRAYDAMHLATALILNETLAERGFPACIFLSADEALLAAARAEGLGAENPNDHP